MKGKWMSGKTRMYVSGKVRAMATAAAAAMCLCGPGSAAAAGNELTAALTEMTDEAAGGIVWIDASWGEGGLLAESAVIAADRPEEILPGTYADIMTAGDTGYLPYGAKLIMQDTTGSLTKVQAAVWTEENGQDDLAWIPMRRSSEGWKAAFGLTDSEEAQLYKIHIYGTDASGEQLLGGIDLTVKQLNIRSAEAASGEAFDALSYYGRYADLRAAIGLDTDALYRHYMEYGSKEGRSAAAEDYSPVFDGAWYLKQYPDLAAVFGPDTTMARVHFVRCGMDEGRIAAPGFNVLNYRDAYPDLRAAFGNGLREYYLHYLHYGIREERSVH